MAIAFDTDRLRVEDAPLEWNPGDVVTHEGKKCKVVSTHVEHSAEGARSVAIVAVWHELSNWN